jgi:hypothetical protein
MFSAKLGKLWSAQLLPKHNLSIPARAVQLENVLSQINANDNIFVHGCSLSLLVAVVKPPWHIAMPFEEGASTASIPVVGRIVSQDPDAPYFPSI